MASAWLSPSKFFSSLLLNEFFFFVSEPVLRKSGSFWNSFTARVRPDGGGGTPLPGRHMGGGVIPSKKKEGGGVGGSRFFMSGGYPPFLNVSELVGCRRVSTGNDGFMGGTGEGYPLLFA
jgi:hypothetical protein